MLTPNKLSKRKEKLNSKLTKRWKKVIKLSAEINEIEYVIYSQRKINKTKRFFKKLISFWLRPIRNKGAKTEITRNEKSPTSYRY